MTQYGRRDFLLALGTGAAAASVAKVSEVLPLSQPVSVPSLDADLMSSAVSCMTRQYKYIHNCLGNPQRFHYGIHWYSNGHWYTTSKAGRRASKKRVTA
jgi:hypothetical protein